MNEFTGKATVYDKARPGYAPAALDFVLKSITPPDFCAAKARKSRCGDIPPHGGGQGLVIADIGAGTGKFSSMLAARGCDVITVEPNADMRSKLPALENLHVVDGTAENTGLPDQCVDAVTCAQAFHWFDGEKFKLECQRILKPGGRVFVVYNNPPKNTPTLHNELNWHPHKYDPARWERNNETMLAFFGGQMRREAFDNPVYFDREHHEAYMLSHSDSPRPGDEIYDRFVESIHEIFDRCNADGKMLLPQETVVYTSL